MAKATPEKVSNFRQEILTQLAFQRARLLGSMLGLSGTALNTAIWDDYSIRRLLPHIALWGGFEAERLSLLRDGRLNELGWMPVDERNAAWHAAHAEITVDAGVAMLQKERNGLQNVLGSLPDELLKATVTLNEDFQLPVLSCITSSIKHDSDHADDIVAWREVNGLARWQNGPQSVLLAAMKASRRALKQMMALVVSAETKKKGPLTIEGWDIKATLAHLAGWEANMLASLPDGHDVRPDQDSDALNAQFVADSAEKSLEQVWDGFEKRRRSAEKLIANRTTSDLQHPFTTGREDINTPYLWICLHIAHDIEHLDEIYGAYLMYTRLR